MAQRVPIPASMKTVAVCCSHPILARGLQAIISHDFISLGFFTSIEELKDRLLTVCPDLLLLEMNRSIDLETLRDLCMLAQDSRIVVWADAVQPEFISQGLSLGIRGVLSKAAAEETHMCCLREVAGGNLWIDRELTSGLSDVRKIDLTPRERQLMALLAQGLKNKEIAWKLGISEGTVKVYLSRLYPKVGADDRFELGLLALKNLSSAPEIPECRSGGGLPNGLAFPATIHVTLKANAPLSITPRPPSMATMAGYYQAQRLPA